MKNFAGCPARQTSLASRIPLSLRMDMIYSDKLSETGTIDPADPAGPIYYFLPRFNGDPKQWAHSVAQACRLNGSTAAIIDIREPGSNMAGDESKDPYSAALTALASIEEVPSCDGEGGGYPDVVIINGIETCADFRVMAELWAAMLVPEYVTSPMQLPCIPVCPVHGDSLAAIGIKRSAGIVSTAKSMSHAVMAKALGDKEKLEVGCRVDNKLLGWEKAHPKPHSDEIARAIDNYLCRHREPLTGAR